MKKVAIVGVEGSGKSVLMSVMGQKYVRPDAAGFFWRPLSFETTRYCASQYDLLRRGAWPDATAPDERLDLAWELFRRNGRGAVPEHVCDISFLDFAGEVYRAAFGVSGGEVADVQRSRLNGNVEALRQHIAQADALVVLVNLSDIINAERDAARAAEMSWLSQQIFQYVFEKNVKCRVAVAFTQKDLYAETIRVEGGVAAAFEKYLPAVFYSYETRIVPFAVSAVNKTVPDEEGRAVPATGFGSEGIEELLAWMVKSDGRKNLSQAGDVRKLVLPDGTTMEMVYCAPGGFMMGSPVNEEGRYDDEIQHRVRLTKGFWIGKYPVTQRQWRSVMGNNPSFFEGDDLPVETVSWDDCQKFINVVNEMLHLGARLPTEAEWEYACRAGTATAYSWGSALNGDRANCDGNNPCGMTGEGPYLEMTTPVGRYGANPWGLCDMQGNVCEWCNDWYGDYQSGNVIDPTGASSGEYRVQRGGGWFSLARLCRSAYRGWSTPGLRDCDCGFRLCCSAGPRG